MAEAFRSASSEASAWLDAARDCVSRLGRTASAGNLGFLYLSDHHAGHAAAIRAHLAAATGVNDWIGTVGMGILSDRREYFDEPAMAVMVGDLPTGSFSVFEGSPRVEDSWFGLVHADAAVDDLGTRLAGLSRQTGAFLVGGIAASRGPRPQFAGGATGGDISGVLFSEAVPVVTGLSQGCLPIGPAHTITACERNVAIGLDGKPALQVLQDDLSEAYRRDPQVLRRPLTAALPVGGADRPDYLVRDFSGFDSERGLIGINAMLENGQTIFFCSRDAESARRDLDRMLGDLKRRAGSRPPRGAIYCSCLARGPNLFGPGSHELGQVQSALGDVPLIGFFANGEIANARLYTYTGVLTLFL